MHGGRVYAVREPFEGQTEPQAGSETQVVLESSLHRYTMDKDEVRYVGIPLIPAGRALAWPGLQQVPSLHRPNQNQGTGSSFREDEKLVDS